PLPYFQEPPYSPYSTPELAEEFPLVLTTGARTWASFHSENRQQPSLRELCPEPLFELHPDKAAELGLKEGDWCWIETPFGKAKQKLTVTPIINPRVAHAMHGWWFPEREPEAPYLYGNWESNINVAMPHGVNGKLGFGDCFKTMICKVYKVEE
ncbi:MAG: dehydrogenase, partial [Eggerthellaceae bacterium]|nr:dehydrogenase [Eggerthellaceae bacterium]